MRYPLADPSIVRDTIKREDPVKAGRACCGWFNNP